MFTNRFIAVATGAGVGGLAGVFASHALIAPIYHYVPSVTTWVATAVITPIAGLYSVAAVGFAGIAAAMHDRMDPIDGKSFLEGVGAAVAATAITSAVLTSSMNYKTLPESSAVEQNTVTAMADLPKPEIKFSIR